VRLVLAAREYAGVSPYSGGVGSHYAFLAPELVRQGHEVHVLTRGTADDAWTAADGVHVHTLADPRLGRLPALQDLLWNVAFWKALRRLPDVDVVFGPEWAGDLALQSRIGRAPVVTNLVTSLAQIKMITGRGRPADRRKAWQEWQQSRLERMQVRRCAGVVACSHAILRWTAEHMGLPEQATVVANFVDVDRVRRLAAGAEPAQPAEPATVLFFGRLEPRKGVEVLAAAARLVWEELPDTRFRLIGGDVTTPEGTRMSARLRALVDDDPRFAVEGPRPPDQLLPAVAAAAIVCLPSLWENFSIAALEAKAVGATLVATTGGGFEDFCVSGEDAVLVAPGDPVVLAAALVELLSDERLRAAIGERAAARAEEFTPRPVTQKLVRELQAMV
jgi:glycogen(starch) synthase